MSIGHEENSVDSTQGDHHEKHDHAENNEQNNHESEHVVSHDDVLVNDDLSSSSNSDLSRPSQPSSDENGYIVVPPTPQTSIDSAVDKVVEQITQNVSQQQDEINKMLVDLSNSTESSLKEAKVVAEADSTSEPITQPPVVPKQEPKKESCSSANKECATGLCPYYALAMNKINNIEVPPKVSDLLLWKNPKLTGAVFGSSFVLLLSLASFSLLTVVGTLLLTACSVIGAYRFYLALLFRIKGVKDDTFEKLSAVDISLPNDKIQEIARLLETDLNSLILKLKSLLLWDNLSSSLKAFAAFYAIYWIGSIFNTLTLLTLLLVDAFTLPKVYQVYKQPIDQALQKATDAVHCAVKQAMVKLPFLNKKKTQ